MSEHNHSGESTPPHTHQAGSPPYWKRAHRDWRFWLVVMVALLLFFAATDNLLVVPGRHSPPAAAAGSAN